MGNDIDGSCVSRNMIEVEQNDFCSYGKPKKGK